MLTLPGLKVPWKAVRKTHQTKEKMGGRHESQPVGAQRMTKPGGRSQEVI